MNDFHGNLVLVGLVQLPFLVATTVRNTSTPGRIATRWGWLSELHSPVPLFHSPAAASRSSALLQSGVPTARKPIESDSRMLPSAASNSPARTCRAMCSHGPELTGKPSSLASSKPSTLLLWVRNNKSSSGGHLDRKRTRLKYSH